MSGRHKLTFTENFKLLKRLEEVLVTDTKNNTAWYKPGFSDKVLASEFPGMNVMHVAVRRREVFGSFPDSTTLPELDEMQRVAELEKMVARQTQTIIDLAARLTKLERELGIN